MTNYGYYLTKLNRIQLYFLFLRCIYTQCQSSSVVGMFLSIKHTQCPTNTPVHVMPSLHVSPFQAAINTLKFIVSR